MSLRGLPDFQTPIRANQISVFYPYEGGAFALLPDELTIGERSDGRPDFTLELVRGQNPGPSPSLFTYGKLDFRLRPLYPMEDALKLLRGQRPDGTLAPVVFTTGFLRIRPALKANELPSELLNPTPLTWNALGQVRSTLKLTAAAVVTLKAMLEAEAVPVEASAEMEWQGVSPRVPVGVRFDPARLMAALLALADKDRQIAWNDVLAFFLSRPSALPLSLVGSLPDDKRQDFAEAMTDRIRMRFGTFIPAPRPGPHSYLVLAAPNQVPSGSFEWNLAEPFQGQRAVVLRLDPFAAARDAVAKYGMSAVYAETDVPPFPTGVFPVSIVAGLPAPRAGVLSIGATLRVPPRPPQRAQAVIQTVEFKPPKDSATVLLKLTPREKLEYLYSTFAVLKDSTGTKRLKTGEVSYQGDSLTLSVADFPLDFVTVEADPVLLDLAVVRGTLGPPEGPRTAFELDQGAPVKAVALPKGTVGAMLQIEVQEREGKGLLKLGPLPAESVQVGPYSFQEYGPQRIEVAATLSSDPTGLLVELLPEGQPETSEEITLLSVTPQQPVREWTWFAPSPFHPGYRYRVRRGNHEAPSEWSEVRPPGQRLEIPPQGR